MSEDRGSFPAPVCVWVITDKYIYIGGYGKCHDVIHCILFGANCLVHYQASLTASWGTNIKTINWCLTQNLLKEVFEFTRLKKMLQQLFSHLLMVIPGNTNIDRMKIWSENDLM